MAAVVERQHPVTRFGERLHPARRHPVGDMVGGKTVDEQDRLGRPDRRRLVDEGEFETFMLEELHRALDHSYCRASLITRCLTLSPGAMWLAAAVPALSSSTKRTG